METCSRFPIDGNLIFMIIDSSFVQVHTQF